MALAKTGPRATIFSYGSLTALLSAVGTIWIFALMLLICADVIGRSAFDKPLLGVPEMVQFSIVGIVFLQLPQTLRSGGLTRSDVLLAPLLRNYPRFGHTLQALFDVTGAVLFVIILDTTWPLMRAAFANNEFYGSTGVVQIATGPLKLIIMIGAGAIAVQFLLQAWQALKTAFGARSPSHPERPAE